MQHPKQQFSCPYYEANDIREEKHQETNTQQPSPNKSTKETEQKKPNNKHKTIEPKPQSVTKREHLLKLRISSQQGWISYTKESGRN